MKIIKMIKGLTVINGKQYAVGDEPFKIDDEAKAARLVKLGVAVYADGAQVSEENPENSGENGNVDVDSMSYDELKEKASELGIKYPGKKKAELIEEIKAALAGEGSADDDNEDAPTFDPAGSIQ